MSKLQLLRVFLNERLTAGAVEKMVAEYQEENDWLQRLLRITPEIKRCIIGLYVNIEMEKHQNVSYHKQKGLVISIFAILVEYSPHTRLKMSTLQMLRVFLNERLTAAAVEIFGAVEKTVAEYQDENDRLRSLLRITPDIKQCRKGSNEYLQISSCNSS
ncbi:unnamed protein product [Coregonus sp. 'balchen']|nr:unnamed protein product [Coregonus sp. 'balchen']